MRMRRLAVLMSMLLVAGIFFAASAFAAYPEKSLNYIITFNPGGESDIFARAQQPLLEKYLGQDVIISYKVGGGGAVGWSEIVKAKPDGYTFAGFNIPHIILQPMIRKNPGYRTEDLKPVSFFMSTPCVLAVKADSPFKNLEDFVKYAKENPGAVTLGGSGSNSANHLGTVIFNKIAGTDIVYVPFTGSGEAIPALLGGHVSGLMTYTTMGVQYKNDVRVLAVAADERVDALPDVPTFKELGYNYSDGAYRGACVPPGTPDEIVNVLSDAFIKVNNEPEFQKKMKALGFALHNFTPEESVALVKAKMKEYEDVVKDLGQN